MNSYEKYKDDLNNEKNKIKILRDNAMKHEMQYFENKLAEVVLAKAINDLLKTGKATFGNISYATKYNCKYGIWQDECSTDDTCVINIGDNTFEIDMKDTLIRNGCRSNPLNGYDYKIPEKIAEYLTKQGFTVEKSWSDTYTVVL